MEARTRVHCLNTGVLGGNKQAWKVLEKAIFWRKLLYSSPWVKTRTRVTTDSRFFHFDPGVRVWSRPTLRILGRSRHAVNSKPLTGSGRGRVQVRNNPGSRAAGSLTSRQPLITVTGGRPLWEPTESLNRVNARQTEGRDPVWTGPYHERLPSVFGASCQSWWPCWVHQGHTSGRQGVCVLGAKPCASGYRTPPESQTDHPERSPQSGRAGAEPGCEPAWLRVCLA